MSPSGGGGCDCKYGVAEGGRVNFAFWTARTNPKIEAFFLQNHNKWVASSTCVLLATNRSLLITALEVGACEGSVPLFRSYIILSSFVTSCWESSCNAGMNGKVRSCATSSGTPVELYIHTHIYILHSEICRPYLVCKASYWGHYGCKLPKTFGHGELGSLVLYIYMYIHTYRGIFPSRIMSGKLPVMCSHEVQEHLWAHALKCLFLRRTHSYMNIPYNKISVKTNFWWNWQKCANNLFFIIS